MKTIAVPDHVADFLSAFDDALARIAGKRREHPNDDQREDTPPTDRPSSVVQESRAVQAITIAEFARRYGIGKTTVYAEVKAGRLRTFKVRGRTLIATRVAEAWHRARMGEAS